MTNDPKTLWREQAPEVEGMDLEVIRARVRAQLARVRRGRVLLVLVTLVGVGISTRLAVSAPTELLRGGEALMAAGFLAQLVLGWRRLTLNAPDTAEACVIFLRETLARRRDAARGGWIVFVAPLLPGMAVTLAALTASARNWLQLAPIVTLLLVWLAILLMIQAREAAKVAVEIARLDQQTRG
jgi:hypothetical protein